MKTAKLLLTLCVFLATFLVGGMAMANDSSVFDPVTSDSTLEAPKLTATIEGNQVTLSWNRVTGATGYVIIYLMRISWWHLKSVAEMGEMIFRYAQCGMHFI